VVVVLVVGAARGQQRWQAQAGLLVEEEEGRVGEVVGGQRHVVNAVLRGVLEGKWRKRRRKVKVGQHLFLFFSYLQFVVPYSLDPSVFPLHLLFCAATTSRGSSLSFAGCETTLGCVLLSGTRLGNGHKFRTPQSMAAAGLAEV
jgi:hypothetical protein